MVDMMKPVPLAEVKTTMRRFLYLGTVDKVRTALANEYSPYIPMPSAKAIQAALDERTRRLTPADRIGTRGFLA
jgi:hypothetical protein